MPGSRSGARTLLPLLCCAVGADDVVNSRVDASAFRQLADAVAQELRQERSDSSRAVLATGEVRVPSGERFDQLARELDATKAELKATQTTVAAQQAQLSELSAKVAQLTARGPRAPPPSSLLPPLRARAKQAPPMEVPDVASGTMPVNAAESTTMRRLQEAPSSPPAPLPAKANELRISGRHTAITFNTNVEGVEPFRMTSVGDARLTCSGEMQAADFRTAGGISLEEVARFAGFVPPSSPPDTPPPAPPPPPCDELWPSLPETCPQPEGLDLTTVNSDLTGFIGGFTNGTHAYLVGHPWNDGANGYAVRISLNDFSASGVTYLYLPDTNSNLNGFVGSFSDGTYAYCVPNGNGYVARIALNDFSDSGVTYLNLQDSHADLAGFRGGFTDGTYAYFVPHSNNGAHGNVARIALNDFSGSGVTYLNLQDSHADLAGFRGGFTDGTYAYFVPFSNSYAVRVALNDFSSSGVTYFNVAAVVSTLRGFWGGFTDGTYAYFVPYNDDDGSHGHLARVALDDFSASGDTHLNLADTNPSLAGFVGGLTDGTHAYFVPHSNNLMGTWQSHGNVARIALNDFSDSGVTYLNLASMDAHFISFSGGFTDGLYAYLVPMKHGKVVRIAIQSHTPGTGWDGSP